MVKKILLVLALVLGALAVVVATRPDTYHVERSSRIDAPPAAVFLVVNDFREFGNWSPWAKRDPAMRTTVSDPPGGVGANYAWEGNKEVGKGRMTFIESKPPERVRQKLESLEPFPWLAETGFDIKPAPGNGALVTWGMDGHNNFVSKAFALVMDMDKTIGKDFDEGLSNLKKVVEAKAAAAAPPPAQDGEAAGGAAPPAAPPAKTR
jgi:Polyketide cyclase / dehydrase and lipid transport